MIKRLLQKMFGRPTRRCQHCGEYKTIDKFIIIKGGSRIYTVCRACIINNYTTME